MLPAASPGGSGMGGGTRIAPSGEGFPCQQVAECLNAGGTPELDPSSVLHALPSCQGREEGVGASIWEKTVLLGPRGKGDGAAVDGLCYLLSLLPGDLHQASWRAGIHSKTFHLQRALDQGLTLAFLLVLFQERGVVESPVAHHWPGRCYSL